MSSRRSSVRRVLKSVSYDGLQLPLDRERRAEVVRSRSTERLKEFAGREDQGLTFTLKMPGGTLHRADLLLHEEDEPGSIAVYLDPDKQPPAASLAWKASFEVREDGALLVHPSLNAGDLEDFLARRLHEGGLLVLRKEGRVILGAPLFLNGKRDEKEKLRVFVREALVYALLKGELERRLRYPPGMEPPPIEIPSAQAAKRAKRKRERAKPPAVGAPPAGAIRARVPSPAGKGPPAPKVQAPGAPQPAVASGTIPAPRPKPPRSPVARKPASATKRGGRKSRARRPGAARREAKRKVSRKARSRRSRASPARRRR